MTKNKPPRPLDQLLSELYSDMAKAGPSPLDDPSISQAAGAVAVIIKTSAEHFQRGLSAAGDLGRDVVGVYFRAVSAVWQKTPLSVAGSRRTDGRYHRRPDW